MPSGPTTIVGSADSARQLSKSTLGDRADLLTADAELLTSEVALAHRPWLVVLIVAAWMGLGFLGAVVMARRGHDFRPLAGLALAFGPLFAGFVAANLRPREQGTHAIVVRPPTELGGDERVAVLIVGDMAGLSFAGTAITETPSTVAQVEIIRPITYETADGSGEQADRDRAEAELDEASVELQEYRPGLTLLPGKTARAMSDHIDHSSPDLVLVVGDPSLEDKLDHRTAESVRVLSIPTSASN